jgi:hypothetical protein
MSGTSERVRGGRSMSVLSVPLPIAVSSQGQSMRTLTTSLRPLRLGGERVPVRVAPTF